MMEITELHPQDTRKWVRNGIGTNPQVGTITQTRNCSGRKNYASRFVSGEQIRSTLYRSYYDLYGRNASNRFYDLCGHINGHVAPGIRRLWELRSGTVAMSTRQGGTLKPNQRARLPLSKP